MQLQHLMPAFLSEGLTDDTARDLTLIDLKALGLGTMSQAHEFKSHVVEFLSGASIEKPHAAAESGVSGAAGAAVPSAPPVDDDCNDVLTPPTLAPACATSAPPVVHPSFALSLSDIPTEFTDQYFTMELLQDPVFAADGFTYERSSMQQWLALGHTTSPKSGALLPNTALVPNHDLRARVQEWVQQQQQQQQ